MKKIIGFIGTGVMGGSMVLNLLKDGYSVNIYNRTKSKTDRLVENGAVWKESPKEVAETSEILMTMLGFPNDVEDIYFDKEYGILEYAKKDSIFIDFTTSTPSLAKKIYAAGVEKGIKIIDAPVSGGDIGARNAALNIMCGGDKDVFDECMPILKVLGKNIILQGEAGSGQHTKMCNQIAIAAGMMGVCEALVYAQKSGLDPERVLESISGGAAGSWSLSNYGPRILNDDFAPGFFIKHFIKDMKIAVSEAKDMDIKVPGLKLALELYEQLANEGYENNGTQALYKWYN